MGNIKHSKAKPQFSIPILITTIVFLLQFSKASASEYDICVNVLEEITNPVNEYNCWKPWIKKKRFGIPTVGPVGSKKNIGNPNSDSQSKMCYRTTLLHARSMQSVTGLRSCQSDI